MMNYKNIFKFLLLVTLLFTNTVNITAQTIASAKDFKVKGFHLDLRIQVMTPEALESLAIDLSEMGINTLIMEWEGTYPYEKHAVISNEYSYTREEVKDFIAYCDSLGIKVIPLQQSLGHVEYILRNPRYSNLKEDRKDISQLCPMEAMESKALFKDLFSDLVETHNSDYIHIGGDESHATASEDFIKFINRTQKIVEKHGKKVVGWDEIAHAELSPNTVIQYWSRKGENALEGIAKGAKILMSPAKKAYLDMKYDSISRIGLDWI